MNTIVVFGASGYLGRALCLSLSQFYQVYAITRVPVSLSGVINIVAETFSTQSVINIISSVEPDCVISCIGLAHRSGIHISNYLHVNSEINLNIYLVCQNCGVQQFIYISSASVYADIADPSHSVDFSEESPLRATEPYGLSKLIAETNLLKLSTKKSFTRLLILRPPAIYGHRCPGSFSTLRKFINYKVPLPQPSPSASRSFLSVSNFSLYIKHFIDTQQCGVFNIADPDLLTLLETFQLVATSMAKPIHFLPINLSLKLLGLNKKVESMMSSFILNTDSSLKLLPPQALYPSRLAIINAFASEVK